jgi:hypothetical protein
VEVTLGNMAAKFDAGLANLAVLQRQQQQHSGGGRLALGMPPNGDVVNGSSGGGRGAHYAT